MNFLIQLKGIKYPLEVSGKNEEEVFDRYSRYFEVGKIFSSNRAWEYFISGAKRFRYNREKRLLQILGPTLQWKKLRILTYENIQHKVKLSHFEFWEIVLNEQRAKGNENIPESYYK